MNLAGKDEAVAIQLSDSDSQISGSIFPKDADEPANLDVQLNVNSSNLNNQLYIRRANSYYFYPDSEVTFFLNGTVDAFDIMFSSRLSQVRDSFAWVCSYSDRILKHLEANQDDGSMLLTFPFSNCDGASTVQLFVCGAREYKNSDGSVEWRPAEYIDQFALQSSYNSDGKLQLLIEKNRIEAINYHVDTHENGLTFVFAVRYVNQTGFITVGLPVGDSNYRTLGGTFEMTVYTDYLSDVSPNKNPFVIQNGETVPAVRLNALPFRAYEAIYNAYYRNEVIDPFILNGQPEYNRYITNDGDGADFSTPLYLRNRNYELDYLTSCVNNPQQGIAPLVGVSSAGVFTFQDPDTGTKYTLTPTIGDDGNTLTGIDSYSDDMPVGTVRMMKNLITHGISINDFRNVNALQTFLEKNIRRGYKYKDQIMSHFGVNVRYDALDMPEFIGGFTRQVNVQQINQSAETGQGQLGDYAGQASLFGQSEHSINHYCDEHGWIIAVMTVVPIPTYSQLLPKYFIKDNLLSYAFPEFNNLGYQPILYNEVAPIQTYANGDNLNDVFGYQRPNYDMISQVDTLHGSFRSTLNNYLITRVFGNRPQLGHDFLTIDKNDYTSPFVDTKPTSDDIIGQVYFDISAQRPVSKFAIPRLEP